uniref:JmjC domain-containing protein n=1 Tax=Odontella aurita TaxID=265563 RepID=A0A7S4HMH8_9STRA|mmetsp:Transcript_12241/g.35928  ORF Transcript_12241/g.35928 Transcript_12241/m.35928 type:complete len:549 (+) Transcript_12241:21-1667(+)
MMAPNGNSQEKDEDIDRRRRSSSASNDGGTTTLPDVSFAQTPHPPGAAGGGRIRPASPSTLPRALLALSDDVGGLWALPPRRRRRSTDDDDAVDILDGPPSPLAFLGDYVSRSRPCIIRNAVATTAAAAADGDGDGVRSPLRLTLDDLVEMTDDEDGRGGDAYSDADGEAVTLTVDVTPDGRGDCVRAVHISEGGGEVGVGSRRRMFVKPEERRMSAAAFREALRAGREEWAEGLRKRGGGDSAGEEESVRDEDGMEVFPSAAAAALDDKVERANADARRPEEEKMDEKGVHSRDRRCRRRRPPVLYYSRQNDCLRTELSPLFRSASSLIPRTFPWAERAFGTGPPDAVNLWVGDERAVSGMHKDHYENLFYVASGEKVFTLCPPGDAPFLHEDEFESGTFRCGSKGGGGEEGGDAWSVIPDYDNDEDEGGRRGSGDRPAKVRWIEPDIDRLLDDGDFEDAGDQESASYLRRFPLLRHAHPTRVYVREGDLLYLPALWFHRVTQTTETVGINYWFDMKFDSPGWCYFNFLQNLHVRSNGGSDGDGQSR